MIKLEIGKKYSTKELASALGTTYNNFRKQKNEYLKSLSMAYEYEIKYKGRSTFYVFMAQLCDYQKPERKNARKKSDKVIQKFINEVIDDDPLQTATNINRIAWKHSNTNPSEVVLLKLKESTTGEYIRLNLREMYGTQVFMGGTDGMIEKKVWCKLDYQYNIYEELSKEMLDDFYKCFDEVRKNQKEIDIDVCADYESGLITREEMRERLEEVSFNVYKEGKEMFYRKYNFYPIKVPAYIKGAWKNEDVAYQIKE